MHHRKYFLLLVLALGVGCVTQPTPWRPAKLGVLGLLGKNWQGRPVDPAPTRADVAYGAHELHRLDFFQASGEGPRPLYVYFHGGGFGWGDKWEMRPSVIRAFHARGISVASCNYRLADSGPLPQPLHDGARAVQFLRSKSADWQIDPTRIAAGGHSAGGLMALWLAAHDDLAEPASADPIARQSTRLTCAATSDAPTNLDATVVFSWFGVKSLPEYPSTKACLAITSLDELTHPRVVALARRSSPYYHVTADDPPVFLSHTRANSRVTARTGPNTWVHHALFGLKLREKMETAGVECVVHYKYGPATEHYRDGVDFVARKFGLE